MRPTRWLSLLASVSAVALTQTISGGADTSPHPVDFTHNVNNAPAPETGAVFDTTPSGTSGTALCTTPTSSAVNVNTDCDEGSFGPHNETSIAVNPTNAANLIGGANDYQLTLNPGGHLSETILSRAHVTFDGGKTWSLYAIQSNSAYQATGDPSIAFDASGHAYYGTLGFRFVGPGNAQNPDVLVANSGDNGKTWNEVRVAAGSGVATSVGDLLDKEYVAAWGRGNAIVSYGDFRLGQKGSFVSARIFTAVTHDFGQTWSAPELVSGNLDQAFVSMPVVAADGSINVGFLNTTDLFSGRDDYEVVKVSPDTGAALTSPTKVATLFDGNTDYPMALGRQTYQDSVFRNGAPVNLAADPTKPGHLAVIWSDMRNSTLPSPADPYVAKTNSDLVVSQSTDGGASWSLPTSVMLARDQFMPWGAYDSTGRLRIGFFDRSGDTNNHLYRYSLVTESTPDSLSFGTAVAVANVTSNPTTGDRWFARTINPAFPRATAFMGDYSNIARLPGGGMVAYWTDMRNLVTFAGRTAYGQDAYFARIG